MQGFFKSITYYETFETVQRQNRRHRVSVNGSMLAVLYLDDQDVNGKTSMRRAETMQELQTTGRQRSPMLRSDQACTEKKESSTIVHLFRLRMQPGNRHSRPQLVCRSSIMCRY